MKTKTMISIFLWCLLLLPLSAGAFYNPQAGRWLSRDPIGELGGTSLYGFVGNDPAMRIDYDGRFVGYAAAGAMVRCGIPYYFAAHWKFNDDQDSLKHCWVSCMMARDCGILLSAIGGVLKEIRDITQMDPLDDIGEDFVADAKGIACGGAECVIPGFGWLTRWFRQSCEDCCRSKGY